MLALARRRRRHFLLRELVRAGRRRLRFDGLDLRSSPFSAAREKRPPAPRPPRGIHTCFWSSSFGMWFPAPPRPMRTYVVIGRVFSLVVFFFSFFFCTAGGHRFVGWIGGRVGMRDSCRRRTEGWLVMCI